MRVVRVNSRREFEVDGEVEIGTFVRVGDLVAVSAEVFQQEDEISKYLSKGDVERIRAFLPDLAEPNVFTRFVVLMDSRSRAPRTMPKVGDEVEIMDDAGVIEAHTSSGELSVPYLPYLMRRDRELARIVVERLSSLLPEYRDVLDIVLAEIEYSLLREVDL
ncbi:hypothetical protein GAH_00977 [Geoglobus ahangari]|uniref:Uncharacterized protein n=1 Tax=Geoglobus ahangari TaxID=113653 RepID=A0A0F7IFP3_9EURY|nr:hypothetical protein [Geoglobus ahangari]AKG91698.1 hypothetical protein GAH_00977 [Geoglobus ahangari]